MDRRRPRPRGGPPGRHGDGSNHLSDAEDSVILRKQSLRRRSDREFDDEFMDNVGSWGPDPARDLMYYGQRSTRGGPQGRRGAVSCDRNDPMDDMDSFGPRGGCAGNKMARHMDAMLAEMAITEREGRAGGRDIDDHFNALSMNDLPTLRESRAYMMETLKTLRSGEERRRLRDNFDMITEDIARLESEQRETGSKPRGMGGSMHRMDSNPRGGRAGGQSMSYLEKSDLATLKQSHAETKESLRRLSKDGTGKQRRILEQGLRMIEEDIARIEYQHRESNKMPRGTGAPTRRWGQEDYSDEESDFQPRGSHRGYRESAAGRRGNSGR